MMSLHYDIMPGICTARAIQRRAAKTRRTPPNTDTLGLDKMYQTVQELCDST